MTRSQRQKDKSDNDQSSETPNERHQWISGYSSRDIENFQREDRNLRPLHDWMDKKSLPTKETVTGYSPATRNYWLNWNNIIK